MVFKKYFSWQFFFLIVIFYSYNLQASGDGVLQQIKEHNRTLLIFGIVIFGGFGIQHWLNKKKNEIEEIKKNNDKNKEKYNRLQIGDQNETDDEDINEKVKKLKKSNSENEEKINNFSFCSLI